MTETKLNTQCCWNVLGNFQEKIERKYAEMGKWFDQHPISYKIAIVAMHLMRAISMTALLAIMPFHPLVNFTTAFAASELYRIVIERHCAFKFARLSCLGGEAFLISQNPLQQFIQQTALETFKQATVAFLSVVPLVVYLGAVVIISNKDVNEKLEKSCRSGCKTSKLN